MQRYLKYCYLLGYFFYFLQKNNAQISLLKVKLYSVIIYFHWKFILTLIKWKRTTTANRCPLERKYDLYSNWISVFIITHLRLLVNTFWIKWQIITKSILGGTEPILLISTSSIWCFVQFDRFNLKQRMMMIKIDDVKNGEPSHFIKQVWRKSNSNS